MRSRRSCARRARALRRPGRHTSRREQRRSTGTTSTTERRPCRTRLDTSRRRQAHRATARASRIESSRSSRDEPRCESEQRHPLKSNGYVLRLDVDRTTDTPGFFCRRHRRNARVARVRTQVVDAQEHRRNTLRVWSHFRHEFQSLLWRITAVQFAAASQAALRRRRSQVARRQGRTSWTTQSAATSPGRHRALWRTRSRGDRGNCGAR